MSKLQEQSENPLVHDGTELIPNVTHVFSHKQHLYLYYEIYEPAQPASNTQSGIRVLSNVLFFNGKVKAYETPRVETTSLTMQSRRAAVFQLDIPLAQLRPGMYTCQVNLIDDAAGRFVFRRVPIKVIE